MTTIQPNESAIVFGEDGSVTIHLPEEGLTEPVSPHVQVVTALYTLLDNDEFVAYIDREWTKLMDAPHND